ncbi:hypothetical protein ACFVVM_16710 [Nocardia sp. NPDC058176]|uniref:hypothetical protein n=1 Tax=Nocardia sp. NPDC058176 TaxID=3346368 RepID=UPI0036DBB47C
MRKSVREFAALLGVQATTVSNWRSGLSGVTPRSLTQEILDTTYAQRATQDDRARFEQILAEGETAWKKRYSVSTLPVSVVTANGTGAHTNTRRAGSTTGNRSSVNVAPVSVAPFDSDVASSLMRSRAAAERSLQSFVAVTNLLAGQRQSIAPDALIGPVEAHRDAVASLYRAATDDRIKRQAGALLGETSVVASRVWSAIGNRPMALTHCAFARKLADELHDKTMGGIARIFESNLRSDAATLIGLDGDVVIGLRVLNEAANVADHLPPAARARIGAEQAQAYAVLDMRDECEEALTRAQRAAEDIDEDDRAGLFSDWNTTRIQVYVGTCLLLLGQPKRAIAALESLISPEMDSPNVALAARVDLASAYSLAGELEHGCTVLGETYGELAAMGNQRGIERAQRAIERMAPWSNERPVLELKERVDSVASGRPLLPPGSPVPNGSLATPPSGPGR